VSHSTQNYQTYQQQRKEWTEKATPLFQERYCEHFDVGPEAIIDVENADGSAYQADAPVYQRLAHAVDYSGADKIIEGPEETVYIAERARKKDLLNGYPRDPSLRFKTPGDHLSPFDKWTNVVESGTSFHLGIMSFGVLEPGAGRPRFDTFALIAMEPWLEAIAAGRLDSVGSAGTNALYYPLDRLQEIDAVLYEE
jgi:hypothetical protein